MPPLNSHLSMEEYFRLLDRDAKKCYSIAENARSLGYDPETFVEIPRAKDLAERVESLVGPSGISSTIRSIMKRIGDREMVAIEVARHVVNNFEGNERNRILQALKTGLAIITEGVLVAPIEGIIDVKIKKNEDGTKFPAIYFAGPIRSAGGTGQALSVLIGDVVRRELGLSRYVPMSAEIERFKEEIPLYRHCQHLQYTPTSEEIELITSNCPICIDGEGTENVEVTGYRDLERVETNAVRGGACLVIAEGMCLKAPKIQKHVSRLNIDSWDFITDLINKKRNVDTCNDKKGYGPSYIYLSEIVAGRPVLSHPSRRGGFRLRYGRSRVTGLAAIGMNPASMYLLDEFIAVGTQIKLERPGKAGAVIPCTTIEGPIVLLDDGTLTQINDYESAKKLYDRVRRIVDVGEILISYGEFVENNHPLIPGAFSIEWWEEELKAAGIDAIPKEIYTAENAFKISEKYGIPLHPDYNLFWHDISVEDLKKLIRFVEKGKYEKNRLILNKDAKEILIKLGCLHQDDGDIIITKYTYPLIRCCGFVVSNGKLKKVRNFDNSHENICDIVSRLSGVKIMPRAPTRIGARMGRPEKSKERKMKPPPHSLFPIGQNGGKQRLINEAAKKGVISVETGERRCPKCDIKTHSTKCKCGSRTEFTGITKTQKIPIKDLLSEAMKKVGMTSFITVKGVQGMISREKTPEILEKGILRAKHGVFVFKDGTIRYDMTDAPATHMKLKEMHITPDIAKKLGYARDYLGKELENDEQIIEIFPQDIIVSKDCLEYLYKVSKYIDELLEKVYGEPSFYNAEKPEDLIGHLVVGLAPHTSAGVLGRIIGYTKTCVCFMHPYFITAKRRNCDGDEDCVMLLMDALLNFSKRFLPDKRGGFMDAPLVLSMMVKPLEVDKEVLNVDAMERYPLEMYRQSMEYAFPKDVEEKVINVGKKIKEDSYWNILFTHDTDDVNLAPIRSRYTALNDMKEKVLAQASLGEKIECVDVDDQMSLVIQKHLLKDILGNLKKFSLQSFRCSRCNAKYRRMPLKGFCLKCGGNIVLTVYESSVIKYLDITKEVSEKHNLSNYTRQRIKIVEKAINSLFQNEKVKKCKLDDFF